ncbi:MAG: hypothetical protein EHM40_07260 [Chloroflexi bacterium]|nr:MAG: hypothetical protein EHM40_07260 [Chloroflexota bacterium]
MTSLFIKWKNGFLTGAVVAALEGILIWVADPSLTLWVFVQSVSFWLFCGLVIYMTETGLPAILNGILLTVLLNIPWYISLSIAAGKPGNLIPLVIASILFCTLIGLMSQKLRSRHN